MLKWKLVYLINSLGAVGAERHLLNLASEMVRRGHLVWVVSLEKQIRGGADSLELSFVEAGVNVILILDKTVGKAMEYANSKNVLKVIFVGGEEVKKKKFKVRDMKSGKESLLSEGELVKEIC